MTRRYVAVRDIRPEPDFAFRIRVAEESYAIRKLSDREAKRLAYAATLRYSVGEPIPPHWNAILKGLALG